MRHPLRSTAFLALGLLICLPLGCSPDTVVDGTGPSVNPNLSDTKGDVAEGDVASDAVAEDVVDPVLDTVVPVEDVVVPPDDAVDPTQCQVAQDCPSPPNMAACEQVACIANTCQIAAAPDGDPCDDGDACTEDSTCAAGACEGASKDCGDDDPCTTDSCDPANGECSHVKIEGCGQPGCNSEKDCDDGNACTQDMCDAATGACVNLTIPGCNDPCAGKNCDDGDKCTPDKCVNAAKGNAP